MIRLAIYTMHPIQYHVPIFRELSKEENLEVTVLYADTLGLDEEFIPEFNTSIKWDVPLLVGYNYFFVKNFSINRMVGFFSRFNPGMFVHILFKKYDAILIHGYQNFTAWLVLVAAKLSGTKIIFRGEAIPKSRGQAIKHLFTTYVIKYFLSACNAVMYSCSGNRAYWKELSVPNEKMFFIPCAVDNNFFRKEKQRYIHLREKTRSDLGIDSSDLVILFLARFTARKRPLDLIEALGELNHKKIVLLFVGDGPERSAMEAAAQKHSIRSVFTGFINQSELPRYYNLADLFVVISSYDASPKALNEAMNFSIPAIVSEQVGTANDLIREGENGFIVKVGDLNTISNRINFLNRNRGKLSKMGELSRIIVTNWSLENDVKGIKEALSFIQLKKGLK